MWGGRRDGGPTPGPDVRVFAFAFGFAFAFAFAFAFGLAFAFASAFACSAMQRRASRVGWRRWAALRLALSLHALACELTSIAARSFMAAPPFGG
jgi:predicted PurR-regulated permease PerM